MRESPYFHGPPIRVPKHFFGRKSEIDQILSLVSEDRPVSIVGPRRIGKTSLLFRLRDVEVRAKYDLVDSYIFVDCDFLELPSNSSKSDVYRWLLRAVARELGRDRTADYASVEPITYLDFKERINAITALEHKKIVLVFDEFDKVVNFHQLDVDFFDGLRELAKLGTTNFITSSVKTLSDLTFHDHRIPSSPFFSIFSAVVWLGFLESQAVTDLIKDDLESLSDFEGFDEQDYAFLREIAGPHPYCLQVACECLFREKKEQTGALIPDYDQVRRKTADHLEAHFKYLWSHLQEDEKRTLKLIGEGTLNDVTEEDLRQLRQKSLVYENNIFASTFAEFIEQSATEITPKTPKDTQVIETLGKGANEVMAHLKEIESKIDRIPFTNVGFLGNFDGFALVEIVDGLGNHICPSGKRSYILSGNQTYELRVTIQSEKPPEGIFENIRLTDGQDVEDVDFAVKMDCDSIDFKPNKLEFTVSAKQPKATTRNTYTAVEKGVHTLFILIYQNNTLVQRIRLELDVQ
jgi:hypothetical protein